MPLGSSALRRDSGCLADHRNRSAAGSGIGPGGDQHGAQPGVERHQPRAGGGRSTGGAIAARRGNRDAARAGRSRAGQIAGRGTGRPAPHRAGHSGLLSAQRAPGALRQGAAGLPGGGEMTDQPMVGLLAAALITFVGLFLAEPILLALGRIFGMYAVVQERTCRVYMLFGKVLGVLDEPGLHFLPAQLGPAAFVINLLGNCYVLDMRLDQEYLRSQPVNSEEGAPMGIGIWYEMQVSDSVAFLFKNTD